MDISFDINNEKGDHILVALSEYDRPSLSAITGEDEPFELELYDVSLARGNAEPRRRGGHRGYVRDLWGEF